MSVGADCKPRVHIVVNTEIDDTTKFIGTLIMNPKEFAVFKARFTADAFTVEQANAGG